MGAVSTIWAPLHRALARVASSESGIPLNAAPSQDFLGAGIQDHRLPYNKAGSSATRPGIIGWYGVDSPVVCNFQPAAKATANIAALANVTSGTAMTLVSSSGSGIIALSTSAPAVFWTPGYLSVSSGVAIDALPTYKLFGAAGNFTTGYYSRDTIVGRCVSITGVSGGAGGNFLVSGYDCYGYPMSQLITVAAGVNTVNSTKAFKVVTSVVPAFTDAHNYSVGTADIFGFGLKSLVIGEVFINYADTVVTAATGFTAADTTSPATTTTGDVRGTYAVQSATDGSKRLVIKVTPSLTAIQSNATTGLFGVTQV